MRQLPLGNRTPAELILKLQKQLVLATKMKIRAIHFDMKAMIPNSECMLSFVEKLASLGINYLLIEFEDQFPFASYPFAAHKDAYTKETFRVLNRKCRELGIGIIPLLQSVGHLDYILKHAEFKDVREGTSNLYQWCLSNPRTWKIWKNMTEEILDVFPDCEFFHIGADEATLDHPCPKCQGKDNFQLYIAMVEQCVDFLKAKGKKAIIWDDMFRNRELKPLKEFFKKVIPCVWRYGIMDENLSRRFADLGIEFWSASCLQANHRYRGMGSQVLKQKNVDDWADVIAKYAPAGHIGTIWGRIQSLYPIESTMPQAMYMIAYLAETLNNGKILDKAEFNKKIAASFFALPKLNMHLLSCNFSYEPDLVKKELQLWLGKAEKNNDILEIWYAFNEIDVLYRYIDTCFSSNEALLPLYKEGKATERMTNNWLDGVKIIKERTAGLKAMLKKDLGKYFTANLLDEFIEQRFCAMLEQNERWGKIIAKAKKDFAKHYQ